MGNPKTLVPLLMAPSHLWLVSPACHENRLGEGRVLKGLLLVTQMAHFVAAPRYNDKC